MPRQGKGQGKGQGKWKGKGQGKGKRRDKGCDKGRDKGKSQTRGNEQGNGRTRGGTRERLKCQNGHPLVYNKYMIFFFGRTFFVCFFCCNTLSNFDLVFNWSSLQAFNLLGTHCLQIYWIYKECPFFKIKYENRLISWCWSQTYPLDRSGRIYCPSSSNFRIINLLKTNNISYITKS